MRYLLFILFGLSIIACNSGNNSGTATSFDSSSYKIENIGNGINRYYKADATGTVIESGYAINGVKNGQWIEYYDDGDLKSSRNYINGKLYGEEFNFNKQGKLKSLSTYKDDVLNGPLKKYKSIRLSEEANYKDGQLNGLYKLYYENKDKIQKEIQFKNGVQDGYMRFFDDQGNLTLEYIYKNGEKVSGGMIK